VIVHQHGVSADKRNIIRILPAEEGARTIPPKPNRNDHKVKAPVIADASGAASFAQRYDWTWAVEI
jgi:hypothetical protein